MPDAEIFFHTASRRARYSSASAGFTRNNKNPSWKIIVAASALRCVHDDLGTGWTQFDKRVSNLRRLTPPSGIRPSPCFAIELAARLTIPCPGTSELRAVGLRGDDRARYNDVVYLGFDGPKHRLLGCKNTDLDDDPANALLLSLDSDRRLKWLWGDANHLAFHLARTDLSNGRLAEAFPHYVDA